MQNATKLDEIAVLDALDVLDGGLEKVDEEDCLL
jgi:hypothetical protein